MTNITHRFGHFDETWQEYVNFENFPLRGRFSPNRFWDSILQAWLNCWGQ